MITASAAAPEIKRMTVNESAAIDAPRSPSRQRSELPANAMSASAVQSQVSGLAMGASVVEQQGRYLGRGIATQKL